MPTQGWPSTDGDHVKARQEVAASRRFLIMQGQQEEEEEEEEWCWLHPSGPLRLAKSICHRGAQSRCQCDMSARCKALRLGSLFIAVIAAPVFA